MLRVNEESVTALARKKKHPSIFVVVGALLLVVFAAGGFLLWHQAQCSLKLTKTCVHLERADTQAVRAQGLSGQESLKPNQGMLFVFDEDGRNCMWMRDMKFAIDIVWLTADKRIVTIKEDALPENFPERYCSDLASRYVIELPAGTVQQNGLQLDQTLNFE